MEKRFVGRKLNTRLHLPEKGRTCFQEYCKTMKQVFEGLPE